MSLHGHQYQEQVLPWTLCLHRRWGGGGGHQRGMRQAVLRDRSTQLKLIFIWLLIKYHINILKILKFTLQAHCLWLSQSYIKDACTLFWSTKKAKAKPTFSETFSCKSFRMKPDGKITNFLLWHSHGFHYMISYSLLNLKSSFTLFFSQENEKSLWKDSMQSIEQLSQRSFFFFSFQYVLWGKEWVSWKKSFLGTFLLQKRGYFNSDDYITSSYIYV